MIALVGMFFVSTIDSDEAALELEAVQDHAINERDMARLVDDSTHGRVGWQGRYRCVPGEAMEARSHRYAAHSEGPWEVRC